MMNGCLKRLAFSLLPCAWTACLASGGQGHAPRPVPSAWSPRRAVARAIRGDRGAAAMGFKVDARDGLSPDEAALMAIDRNPRLAVLRRRRGVARLEVVAAGILPNPRIEASLLVPAGGREALAVGFGVGVSWNLSPLLRRSVKLAAARLRRKRVDLEVAWLEWGTAMKARLTTARLIYLERRVGVARRMEAVAHKRAAAYRRASDQHAVGSTEVYRAARDLAAARERRMTLEEQVERERGALGALLDLSPDARIHLDVSWQLRAKTPALRGLLTGLPRRRLDLLALQHGKRAARAALRAAHLRWIPPLELGVSMSREVDRVQSVGLSLSFELPIFKRGQVAVARLSQRRGTLALEYRARLAGARAAVAALVRRIGVTQRSLRTARSQVGRASARARRAQRAVSAAGLAAMAGLESRLIWLGARLRQLELEQRLAELHIALAAACGVYLR